MGEFRPACYTLTKMASGWHGVPGGFEVSGSFQ